MTAQPLAPSLAPRPWLSGAARPHRRLAGMAALATIADVAPAVGFAAGLALAVHHLPQSPVAAAPWIALAVVALAARGLLGQGALVLSARLARRVKAEVRTGALQALFASPGSADKRLTAAVEGVEALDGYYARFAPARTAAALSPLLLIAAAALASPMSAAILLFTLVPFIAGMALAGTAAAAESRRQFDALERLSGLFLDRVRALPALLAFGAEARTAAEIEQAATTLAARTSRVLRVAFLSSGVLEFFSALSVALVAVYCGFNLLRLLPFPAPETLDLPRALFVLALAPEVYAPMRRLAAAYHDRQAAEAAAPALQTPPVPAPASTTLGRHAPGVSFRSVAIGYGAAPVIQDLDLEVRPGQIVALTGASGSGKSSLLHLLLGLVPLADGEVEVGGAAMPPGGFAGQIAWASQNPVVLPGTLFSNIVLAHPQASRREVMRAAGLAGLHGDLDRPLDERGGGLSGGERRRLGLARALLKPAPLLLLDEPTANLDPESEARIIAVIRRAAEGRTTLVATHSPAVTALADRVVRL